MKKIASPIATLVLTSLLTSTSAHAWFSFTNTPLTNDTTQPFTGVKGNASGNPDFGGEAWAMHGKWTSFNATKGASVTILIQTTTANASNPMHPALTLWKRPQGSATYKVLPVPPSTTSTTNTLDFAANNNVPGGYLYNNAGILQDNVTKAYAVDHNFIPTNSFVMDNVKLEDGTLAGDVRMIHLKSMYDNDAWSKARGIYYPNNQFGITAVQDGTPGRLEYTFTAPETGNYQMFIGGYRPENGLNSNFNVDVKVTGIN